MNILICGCLLFAAFGAATSDALSPVTRVVELLKGLSAQAEKEGKVEEGLYEDYVCWGKSIINQKTASNAAAASRIDELETYIADLDAGRIELTSERADLEKDIAELMSDMEKATALRKKEHADFLEAEDEMTKAVTALKSAIDTLDEATKDHKDGVLLAVRTRLQGASANGGMAALAQRQAALKQAVELGERYLAKADATFLKRLLLGDVPKVDWKKLNRKATFKMAYKARSFKIQDVLAKMLATFETNLKDATTKEDEANKQYLELKKSKTGQLTESQDALSKQDGENGAKATSKEDAQNEVDALKLQVKNDKKFITQTAKGLEDKKGEWKDRQALRTGEIAAINKAIGILHSDDARDTFKKSLDSQSFLQTSSTSHISAVAVLRKAASGSGDRRLALLASSLSKTDPMATGSHFDEVIAAIDKMVGILKGEEKTDLENKETCEKDRADDTRSAVKAARTMDEHTDTIEEKKARIAEIVVNVADNKKEIVTLKAELKEAVKDRKDSNQAWQNTNKDDKAAAELVNSAKGVLTKFYADNDLMFIQNKMDPITAGEAPPPPPSTWEAPYGGKTGESTGIIAILEMIHEDIQRDMTKAKEEEDTSKANFEAFKKDTEAGIKKLEEANNDLEGEKGEAEDDVASNKKDRLSQKNQLDATLKKISDATPGCDYLTINYDVRLKNRQIEIDGLVKAKAILEGGEFPSFLEDHQTTSGDAFLQRRK